MIPWLLEASDFPTPDQALDEPNGLLAFGGDLSEQRLLNAYRHGIFPWYSPGDPIMWWSPNPRCVLFPDQLHLSRSLRKALRRREYRVTLDQNFAAVMQACAEPRRGEPGTWISRDMLQAYCQLHRAGWAHSVELWQQEQLVGGLYGIAMGRLFFGESMFSRQRDASKIAFAWLVEQLREWGYALVDCQVSSPHLMSLGAREIPRQQFLGILDQHAETRLKHPWQITLADDWFERPR
ncbi:leucyl/phenylalanyl-tRNA--protein transferase [Marinobacterium arenosum]|uniref:leucyl/phenylalanyl-tRNA--protein transferase n=1 Tax=Marinobacterium arenosum TaxID=2862496 RepID=UPI001C94D062|nr:leucyl/phenylalanyl-tRNA--protein transferase [Marinobacterium arenosum]MBY4677858.1 leucyl/phenylalanyl-tRNA--protein transferase [Marinobacterium arenosum]